MHLINIKKELNYKLIQFITLVCVYVINNNEK